VVTTKISIGGEKDFIAVLKDIVSSARSQAYAAVNFAQVKANWLIGRQIVEQEQRGKKRAEYGKHVIRLASAALTEEYGHGFSSANLKNFRRFYLLFRDFQIGQAVPDQLEDSPTQSISAEIGQAQHGQFQQNTFNNMETKELSLLSWTHYERLLRVDNSVARDWYMREAASQHWSYRTLDRNISTQYYERLLSSQLKEPVIAEMREKTKAFERDKLSFIKNPTVLEFLGLPGNAGYTENDLENAILTNLQKFLLELGKGFAFIERQRLVRTEARDYFIDLVFYNYILKCFILIDLKTSRVSHQDVGQMDMYVRMFDERERGEDDNPTIGIVLCSETDQDIARYSVLKGNEQLFASKYKLFLPTDEELRAEIERQKEILSLQFAERSNRPDNKLKQTDNKSLR
jgi:predicted nuclease of restriction endonuclease-like (RecB) superfamily